MTNSQSNRQVGPVITRGEIGDAVLEAIYEDNEGRNIEVEEHASYVRIKVDKECVVRFDTVSNMLGRDVTRTDVESNLPSFEGFIRVDTDKMRFLATSDEE